MVPLQVVLFRQLQGRSNYKDTDLPNFYCNVLCLKRFQDVEKMLQSHCQNPVYLFFKQERGKCLEWQYLRYNFSLLPSIPWQLFIQQSVIIHCIVFSQCALFCQYTMNSLWPLHYLHLISWIFIGAKSPFSGSEISSSQEGNAPHCLFTTDKNQWPSSCWTSTILSSQLRGITAVPAWLHGIKSFWDSVEISW